MSFGLSYLFRIRAKTIRLTTPRDPFSQSEKDRELVLKEAALRRLAYKKTSIKINDSFFDDSDMLSEYYLILVYDKKSGTPLLSARYYFSKTLILSTLQGEDASKSDHSIDLGKFPEGSLFLADRLSGNTSSSFYRKYRNYIFLLFYSEIINYNKNCHYILMARKEKREKLLTKYLRLGLTIAGSTLHKDKEHWILLGDVKKSYADIRTGIFSNLFLVLKTNLKKRHA